MVYVDATMRIPITQRATHLSQRRCFGYWPASRAKRSFSKWQCACSRLHAQPAGVFRFEQRSRRVDDAQPRTEPKLLGGQRRAHLRGRTAARHAYLGFAVPKRFECAKEAKAWDSWLSLTSLTLSLIGGTPRPARCRVPLTLAPCRWVFSS